MKNQTLATLGTLALLTAGTAFAQQRLSVDVPFEFSFASRVMPAGHYDVTRTGGVLEIHDYSARAGAMATVQDVDIRKGRIAPSGLAFNKYGDKYFLAEAWNSDGAEWGVAASKSKAEREIAHVTADVARVTIPARTGAVTLLSLK